MTRRVFCHTLGCDKNLVDSEALLGRFAHRGVVAVDDPDRADIWVLNTCGFIDAARADSDEALRAFVAAKAMRTLVVCGCWTQEHGDEIRRRYPEIDVVAGVGEFDRVVAACLGTPEAPDAPAAAGPLVGPPDEAVYAGLADRPLLTPPHVAFVKLGEGCNCHCTFCRIPLIRGRLRSRPSAEIVAEVRGLVQRGVGEIQLVSQNTSDYGRDTGETLLDLVTALDRVTGLRRIRLLYLYAGLVSTDTLLRLLDLPTVVPYLDLPIQHASPRLLRAMRRPGGETASPRFFGALRAARPDLVLRTTALLGFPGEDDDDVARLADFLAEVEFDHLGTYRYSPEQGTPAASLPDPVPAEVSLDREALIMDLQAEISLARQIGRLDRRWEVVVDSLHDAGDDDTRGLLDSLAEGSWPDAQERSYLQRVCRRGGRVALGRSVHYGYDIDGVVVLPGEGLSVGQWLPADFRAATAYDTWAVPRRGADSEKGHA